MRRTLSKSSKRVKQTNLRMPEDLRLRVMREADKNRVSFNREVLNRLHSSFDADTKRTIADVTNGLAIASARLLHDLQRQAELVRRVNRCSRNSTSRRATARLPRPSRRVDSSLTRLVHACALP